MKWTKKTIRILVLRTVGNFLILFSLWGMALTFGPAVYLEIIYRINALRNVTYTTAAVAEVSSETAASQGQHVPTEMFVRHTFFGQMMRGDTVQFLSPVSPSFGIVIPKIGANAPIVANVDAGNPDVYLPALQHGVGHALGTVFPGTSGNIFLFAHSTDSFWQVSRYNAIFFLLKELAKGDEIDVFYQNQRHIYRVTDRLIVDPSAVEYLTHETSYEQLTLQTCWPPGTSLQRLIVIAKPESQLGE